MLQIDHLSFSYKRFGKQVFSDFSLQLAPGHIYGLLGKNGTGKSTLLYLMSGLLRAQQGCITYHDKDVKLRLPEIQSDYFLVPEEFVLPNMRMSQYVALNAPFYPAFDRRILQECLTDFELPQDPSLAALSMGEKKKAFMSFALATGVHLLLMDEPTNGLDIPSKSLFRRVIAKHITENCTLVISTHQVGDIDMLLDHVIILDESDILLDRSTADICRALRFEERPMNAPIDDALYSQPSLQGHAVIVKNERPDEESLLNLELLFNATLARKLTDLFDKQDIHA